MTGRVLVIGMSHVEALAQALRPDEAASVRIINLNRAPKLYSVADNLLSPDAYPGPEPELVCLSVGGNFHNIFGLIELPQPISLRDARRGSVPLDAEAAARHWLPHGLMRAHFQRRLERLLQHLEPLHRRFAGARFLHLSAPPPIGDAAHLRAHPGIFASRMARGIAPFDLRQALYRIQRDIAAERAQALGARFLDPPAAALDRQGALAEGYWADDPTHGNAVYGRLVLDQIATERRMRAA